MYSRLMYAALKVQASSTVAVKPDTFFPVTKIEFGAQYRSKPSVPIIGNRTININPIKDLIEPPAGTLGLQIEPKTFGFFLRGVYGAISSGRYFPISGGSGTFTAGETITGGSSGATASIVAVSTEGDYLLVGAPTGSFTIGETITGGSSSATATLGTFSTSVYGHQGLGPQSSLPFFTLEIGLENEAHRYIGVNFNAFNSIAHEDNIITAELAMVALYEFKHARVTAVTASGAGSKTITIDQTTGLLASDTVKVFRPSTGAFLDFSAASTKTHTINAVSSETAFTVTNLETSLAVGDLVVLAPQTPSYSLSREFAWIGGSIARIADNIDSAVAASAASIEEFEFSVMNETEGRHAANGTNLVNRFPIKNHLKKFDGEGKIKKAYDDQTLFDRLRNSTQTALQIKHVADQIGSTGLYYTIDWRIPFAVFEPWSVSAEEDTVLDDDVSFKIYRSSSDGFTHKVLLLSDVSSY